MEKDSVWVESVVQHFEQDDEEPEHTQQVVELEIKCIFEELSDLSLSAILYLYIFSFVEKFNK
ncbi:MAG: hypothetical protein ACLQVY_05880 [Limisphaerales bacterium]